MKRQVLLGSLVALGVLADLATKAMAFAWVALGETTVLIPGLLRAQCSRNTGVAFGLFAKYPMVHIFISGGIILFLLYLFYASREQSSGPTAQEKAGPEVSAAPGGLWFDAAIGLILTGALGNLIDRVWLGKFYDPNTQEWVPAVRDFISIYVPGYGWWPTFNIADAYITLGVSLYLILHANESWRARRSRRSRDDSQGARTPPSGARKAEASHGAPKP